MHELLAACPLASINVLSVLIFWFDCPSKLIIVCCQLPVLLSTLVSPSGFVKALVYLADDYARTGFTRAWAYLKCFPESFRITKPDGEPKTDSKTGVHLRYTANKPCPYIHLSRASVEAKALERFICVQISYIVLTGLFST